MGFAGRFFTWAPRDRRHAAKSNHRYLRSLGSFATDADRPRRRSAAALRLFRFSAPYVRVAISGTRLSRCCAARPRVAAGGRHSVAVGSETRLRPWCLYPVHARRTGSDDSDRANVTRCRTRSTCAHRDRRSARAPARRGRAHRRQRNELSQYARLFQSACADRFAARRAAKRETLSVC